MSEELKVGITDSVAFTVAEDDCITRGEFKILSTPKLVGHLETSAMHLMERYLGPGQATVGTYVEITHSAPALLGDDVTVTAKVTAIDGSRTTFSVEARDVTEQLATARHERFTVDLARLEDRLRRKSSG